MLLTALSFCTAFGISYFLVPYIIKFARTWHLFDVPVERSSHEVATPSLGGLAIFGGAFFTVMMWTPFRDLPQLQYFLAASLILLIAGARDDITPISPFKKMTAQIAAASIVIFGGGIRLEGFYGVFGLHDQGGEIVAILLSYFAIMAIVNAFNLIDGIDGLAGGMGAFVLSVLAVWFFLAGQTAWSTVAWASAGAAIAFLRYNISPARIFMGDTGSLFLGLTSAVLLLTFVDINYKLPPTDIKRFTASPIIALTLVFLPLFDAVRVGITRIFRGYSPFRPDRRHIHHMLIDYGMTHTQASGLLIWIQMTLTALVFALDGRLDLHLTLVLVLAIVTALAYWLHLRILKHKVRRRTA
jgi:UDP-GlcNAc:undecaprenyl-phosphate GlcNAc-1-phosphate transferase